MHSAEVMFSLIKSALFQENIDDETMGRINSQMRAELFSLSRAHDLAHMVGIALSKIGKLEKDEISEKFKKSYRMAVWRYERLNYDLQKICETLEKAEIPFLPLKGAVIRHYYPDPWMRTSCDLDVLVHESDLEKAVLVLEKELQYQADKKKNFHDISLYSKSGTHLELHYNMYEDIKAMDSVLDRVWAYAVPTNEEGFQHKLTNEFQIFHIIAHMAYHFLGGGCGVRPLADLFLAERNIKVQKKELYTLLEEAGLTKFYENIKDLAAVWFGDKQHTKMTRQIEAYILSGGAYGTLENRVTMQRQKKNGRAAYMLYRIFLPYEKLTQLYPILKKHRYLTPLMEVDRWCKIIFSKRIKRMMREMKMHADTNSNTADTAKTLIEELGL